MLDFVPSRTVGVVYNILSSAGFASFVLARLARHASILRPVVSRGVFICVSCAMKGCWLWFGPSKPSFNHKFSVRLLEGRPWYFDLFLAHSAKLQHLFWIAIVTAIWKIVDCDVVNGPALFFAGNSSVSLARPWHSSGRGVGTWRVFNLLDRGRFHKNRTHTSS